MSLPTPASTPCDSNTSGEQTPTPLPSQHIAIVEPDPGDQAPAPLPSQPIAQREELDLNDPTDLHKNLSRETHDKSPPAAQQKLENRSQPSNHISIGDADDSEGEQATSESQHSANLDVSSLADHSDNISDQDARPSGQSSGQTTTSSVQYRSNATRYQSRKRKQNFEGSSVKHTRIEAADATDVELGGRSLKCSEHFECRPVLDKGERRDQQPEILEAVRDGQLSIAAVTTPALPQTAVTSRRPSAEPPTYGYSPLQHADEIRLLTIEPGEQSGPMQCDIFHSRISDHPLYEALSYTWGSEETPNNVRCGGKGYISVTRNCFEAIRRLRQIDRSRAVWIDAVCINQTNINERNHQVELMPRIYQQAATVIVYLGEAEDDSNLAMDYLSTYAWILDPPTFASPLSKSQSALKRLISRAWFSRIWVLQEVFMARSAVVLCGSKSIRWDFLRRLAKWTPQDSFGKFPRVLTVGNHRVIQSYSSRDFFKLLCDVRDCDCKDPHDRIFALFSMGSEDLRLSLTVDYTTSVETLFTTVARHLIDSIGLDALCGVDGRWECSNIPSWVPDWRIPARSTPMTVMVNFNHSAGGLPSRKPAEFLSSPSAPQKVILRAQGHRLCSVDILGEIFRPSRKSWGDMIRKAWSGMFTAAYPGIIRFFSILYMEGAAHSWVYQPKGVCREYDTEAVDPGKHAPLIRLTQSKEEGEPDVRDPISFRTDANWIYGPEMRAVDIYGSGTEADEIHGDGIGADDIYSPKTRAVKLNDPGIGADKLSNVRTKVDEVYGGEIGAVELDSPRIQAEELENELMELELESFPFSKRKRLHSCCTGRRIFRTANAAGLVPAQTQQGDIIYIFYGARTPFVLRKEFDHFILIGACFVEGVMNGHLARYAAKEIEIW